MLSPDLNRAARNLDERLALLRIPCRRVAPSEWAALLPSVRDRVAAWLPELLAKHALFGAVLEYRDARRPHVRLFGLFDPAALSEILSRDSVYSCLLDFGYFPLAAESDGALWVVPLGAETGPVYLLELSDWNGERPTAENGLTFAAEKLEFILASMGVSEASYYANATLPRYIMWYSGARNSGAENGERGKGGRSQTP